MEPSKQQVAVVVPAAGIGKRMEADCPKQYLMLNGKTIIEHTLSRLISHPQIAKVIVALNPEDTVFSSLTVASDDKVVMVEGGAERADSVLAGLESMDEQGCEWVMVHDAARPCITHDDISKLITFCVGNQSGAVLATPVRDTMKRTLSNQEISHTESRDNLWHALTPQMYKTVELKTSLKNALASEAQITDESSAIEWAKLPSSVVIGRDDNLKITRPNDLALASFYLTQQQEQQQGETCNS